MTKDDYKKVLHDTLDFSIYIGHNICPGKINTAEENHLLKVNCAALLIRALTKAHAINVLFQNDLGEEANIVLRVLIEIQFIICSIEKDDNNFKRYLADIGLQKFKSLKSLEHAAKYPECIFSMDDSTKKKIGTMTKEFKGKRLLTIREHAENAGMLGLYYSSYSTLCKFVHSGPSEVQDHLHKKDEKLTVSRINRIEPDLVIFSGIEAMKNILNCIARTFNHEYDKLKQLNDIYLELNQLLYRKYILNEKIIED